MNRTPAWYTSSVAALCLGVACSSASSTGAPPVVAPDSSVVATDSTSAMPDAAEMPGEDAAVALPFVLESDQIVAGESFPAAHTCTGANTSPRFSWTSGPAGTLSYALVLNDLNISFLHSVSYDIPADTLELPAKMDATYAPSVPAGARQTKNYGGASYGYIGPCPPSGEHMYEFTLYALDVATLPGLDRNTALKAAVAAVKARAIGSATLRAKYKKP